jgi:hypothetical protein
MGLIAKHAQRPMAILPLTLCIKLNAPEGQSPTVAANQINQKRYFSPKVQEFDIMTMEGHLLQLPEDDRELDLSDVLGDPIQRAILPIEFFDAVASRISNQIISFKRLVAHLHIGTRPVDQASEGAGEPIGPTGGMFLTKTIGEIRA